MASLTEPQRPDGALDDLLGGVGVDFVNAPTQPAPALEEKKLVAQMASLSQTSTLQSISLASINAQAPSQSQNEDAELLAQIAQADPLPEAKNKAPTPELEAALNLMRRRKFHEAIQSLKKLLPAQSGTTSKKRSTTEMKDSGDVGAPYILLGICYLMRDQHQNAFHCFQKHQLALSENTEKALFWYAIGLLYFEHSSYNHAHTAFQACLEIPCEFIDQAECQFRIAIACKHQKKFEAARSILESLKVCPPQPLQPEDILFHLGHIFQLSGFRHRALSTYAAILRSNPTHTTTLRQLAWLKLTEHTDKKQLPETTYREVLSHLDAALKCGEDARTWYMYCRCQLARHKYTEAHEAIKKALALDPMNATYWYFYGTCTFENSLYLKALNAYLRVLHLNPNFPNVWVNVAKLYQLYNQTEDAILAYQQAQKQNHSPQIANQIAWLQKQLKIKVAQETQGTVSRPGVLPAANPTVTNGASVQGGLPGIPSSTMAASSIPAPGAKPAPVDYMQNMGAGKPPVPVKTPGFQVQQAYTQNIPQPIRYPASYTAQKQPAPKRQKTPTANIPVRTAVAPHNQSSNPAHPFNNYAAFPNVGYPYFPMQMHQQSYVPQTLKATAVQPTVAQKVTAVPARVNTIHTQLRHNPQPLFSQTTVQNHPKPNQPMYPPTASNSGLTLPKTPALNQTSASSGVISAGSTMQAAVPAATSATSTLQSQN